MNQGGRVGQAEHACHCRRRKLAQAVAEHRVRLDPPGTQHPGERVLDAEQQRLGRRRVGKLVIRFGQPVRMQVCPVEREQVEDLLQRFGELRVAPVQAGRYGDLLRALAGKGVRDLVQARRALDDAPVGAEGRRRVPGRRGHDGTPYLVGPTPFLEGTHGRREDLLAFPGEMAGELVAVGSFGLIRPGRPDDDPRPDVARRQRRRRALLEHHVRVRPADAERAHPGAPRPARLAAPGAQAAGDIERGLVELELGVGLGEVGGPRDMLVAQGQHHLDQRSRPRGMP